MKISSPRVTRRGTAREIAEQAAGYVANGMGEFSRAAAHAKETMRQRGQFRDRLTTVERYKHEIAVLRKRIGMENNPQRLTKLSRDLAIKNHLLARMMRGEARS